MGGRDWGRWASWTGVVFGVLLFLGVMVGGNTPDTDASPQKVVAYYSSHHSGQQASVFLIAYALIFGLFFAGALRSYLRPRSSGDGLIAVGLAGMAVLAASAGVLAGINFAATDVTTKISPDALQALNVLQNDVFFGLLIGTSVFLIGNGLAIVRSAAALPTWLGWVGAALGALAVTPIGWIVLLFALPLWSVIVSVLMFVRQAAPAPAAAPATG
jgi:hypothetical protein